ncbi:hypothetical protein AWB78_06508 [Caballeronia calidae]|uniref:Carbohydrate binding domain protein n=1 Tax=Caballeronia calidae TaxID=1777139 RepID=A0A158E8J4_9BURK|nr:hypothetical protein [Caballeronia calidae]SAL03104.1 hypothetical protein AWB78_06508 [Caballeronia calidae]
MRDVTGIPDALLDVIARVIRQHVQSCCAALVTRLDALEKLCAREPVVNVTSFPVKDHSETIESLRREQEQHTREAGEDRRAIDRLQNSIDALGERVNERFQALTIPTVKDYSETIEGLRREQEQHASGAVEDRRAIDRLQTGIDALGERVNERFQALTIPTVKDYSEAIEGLRREHEQHASGAAEDRRAIDRLQNGIDALGERVNERFQALTIPTVKDYSEAIEGLRREQEQHASGAVEDRRAIDRLQNGIDALGERVNERFQALTIPTVKDYSEAIEGLRREHEQHASGAAEDRRALDRLQHSFAALGERLKTLETCEMPIPKDGEPGRDAFEIDVLPVIDFGRDYPRGTLAQHQGGIWRAHANTHGGHGWSCVVDGIASTHVSMESERSFTVHIERASGAHESASFAVPVMIYRGVYRGGETYRRGDVVTWAGSLWHCNATTDTKPDAGGDAWTLAAKRGRDGKDRMRVVGEAA